MKFLVAVLLSLASLSSTLGAPDCKCRTPEPNETTHWVGNLETVFRERKAYRVMRGVVVKPNGKPLGDALVEVFTHPEYLLEAAPTGKRGRDKQRRVAACKTDADGKFCFTKLPPGRYELRASSDDTMTGWNASQVYVVINPHGRRSKRKEIRVEMTLGI